MQATSLNLKVFWKNFTNITGENNLRKRLENWLSNGNMLGEKGCAFNEM